jgi:hypothetical protein
MYDGDCCSYLLATVASQTCPSAAPAPRVVKSSLHSMCIICLADATMEGQHPGILELDDEAEDLRILYHIAGRRPTDCLPCAPGSWLHCMRCTVPLAFSVSIRQSAFRFSTQQLSAQHPGFVQLFARIHVPCREIVWQM